MWISIAALTALAVLSVLVPLGFRRAPVVALDADRAFYEAQISEIERDVARGVLSLSDAESAKAEAARRLIEKHDAQKPAANSDRSRRLAAALAILFIPGLALGLYMNLGNPDLPDIPLSARLTAPPVPNDVFAAIAKIEQHLATNPDDARGWEIVAPVYLKTGRPRDAVNAWNNVIRIAGPSPDRYTAIGEALLFAEQGKVSPEALGAFEKALELEPRFPQARFYVGLAAEQAGNVERARAIWSALVADAPEGASWIEPVRARIAALGPQIKVPAPDELAARAVTALPQGEQQTVIRSMVERLAARLKEDGKDPEGWLMLINAYNVQKEPEKARDALSEARKALSGDEAALEKLKTLARQLGLEG